MAVKSVIDIDLKDEKFQQFTERWEKYQSALTKLPGAWADISKEQGKGASELERMTAALLAQNELLHAEQDADEKRLKRLTASERLWTSMAKSSASMAKNVLDISGKILGWGSLIAGGLLGGSLFGIDRMARDVSNSRRSAMGLGLSIGEQKSFNVNFERLMDPDFLSQVAEMKMDPSKAGPLYTMGVGTGGSTEDTAIALIKAMREKALATPVGQLGLLDAMTGLSAGTEEWRRLHDMKAPEFNSLIAGNRRDIGGLGIGEGTAKGWQDFTTQMERAGGTIFKVFVQGLAPLSGPLTHLSAAFTGFVTRLFPASGDGPVQKGIENLGHWIDGLSGKLSAPEFLSSVDKFMSSTGQLAGAIQDLADFIHTAAHPIDAASNKASGWMSSFKEWLQPTPAGVTSSEKSYLDYLGRKDMQYGFPSGLLEKLHIQESGGSLYPKNSPKGAIGAFGFMPDTAKQYGIDPHDPVASAHAGPQYLYDLEQKYKGDLAKALAAYNWGQGNLDKDIAAHGKDWGNFAPKETQDYVRKIGGINITVSNNTGGSAQVSVNALQAGP